MRALDLMWRPETGWNVAESAPSAQFVIYFGPRSALERRDVFDGLRNAFPNAALMGCSSGGQIVRDDVEDEGVAGMAFTFDTSSVRLAKARVETSAGSRAAGAALGSQLAGPDLRGVFVLSDGLAVNGSELVAGIASVVDPSIPVNGGLAGDGAAFEKTLVGVNGRPEAGVIGAVGFYGKAMRIGHGSAAGWDVFGPERRITGSSANVLHTLDGRPALDLYERYLGDEAKLLPASGLLYPLKIFDPQKPGHDVVRTLLSIDRSTGAMTFAGDMPEGWVAQLMRGNLDHLVDGSAEAARQAAQPFRAGERPVALMVSCIGRRIFLGQRVNEEIEAACAALGAGTAALGFYSYGEIAPHAVSGCSELHNQTMTVFTLAERAA